MVEAFVSTGIHGVFRHRKQGLELLGHQNGIAHFILCLSRMDAPAMHYHLCPGSIKILIFQFPKPAAVNGIGIVRTKKLDIKIIRSRPHFLVRGKTNPYLSMGDFWVCQQVFRHCHNFCNSRFVIRPQKGGTVCDDQPFPLIRRQLRKIRHFHHYLLFLIEQDIPALVIFYNPGLYPIPCHCR